MASCQLSPRITLTRHLRGLFQRAPNHGPAAAGTARQDAQDQRTCSGSVTVPAGQVWKAGSTRRMGAEGLHAIPEAQASCP